MDTAILYFYALPLLYEKIAKSWSPERVKLNVHIFKHCSFATSSLLFHACVVAETAAVQCQFMRGWNTSFHTVKNSHYHTTYGYHRLTVRLKQPFLSKSTLTEIYSDIFFMDKNGYWKRLISMRIIRKPVYNNFVTKIDGNQYSINFIALATM